jgi:transcriptional regulator with XRE-family HTH domain
MAKISEILVEGRRRRGWSQLDLAVRAQVSLSTVSRTEQEMGLPNVNSIRRLAGAIGYDAQAMVRLAKDPGAKFRVGWLKESGENNLLREIQLHNDRTTPRESGALPPPQLRHVPHYGRVSAVRADLREEDRGDTSLVPDIGVDFTVSVDGQCMEPRYEDGERVGCSIRRWEKEGFVWGKDYWIRFTDGQTTLKRVKPDPRNREKFICLPLNPKARPFSRLKEDVDRAARILVVLSG